MKILLVINGMHPKHGGPPTVVAGSAIALSELGHVVKVLTICRDQDEETIVRKTWRPMLESGVELVLCSDEGLAGLFGRVRQRTLFSTLAREADVVHIHGVWSGLFIVFARTCKGLGIPYFVSTHGLFDHRAMKREKLKYTKKLLAIEAFRVRDFLRSSSAVIFGSEAEVAESWLPTKDVRIEAVPNGVSASIGTAEATSEQLTRLHSIVPQMQSWKRIVLCRSRIHPEKGHDMLVAAFDRLATEFPDTGLLIAGLSQVESYEAKVREKISQSPHRDRMVLTTKLIGPENQFVSSLCTIYATPSIAEGFSMSLVEGLANGKAMLVTKYCHMPLVETSGSGVIVEPNTHAIEAGLRNILSMGEKQLQAMGSAARKLFLDNYTWEKVALQLQALYARAKSE